MTDDDTSVMQCNVCTYLVLLHCIVHAGRKCYVIISHHHVSAMGEGDCHIDLCKSQTLTIVMYYTVNHTFSACSHYCSSI